MRKERHREREGQYRSLKARAAESTETAMREAKEEAEAGEATE